MTVRSDKGEVGIFLKLSLQYKEVLLRNKVEEMNRNVVFKRESFVSHPEDHGASLKNFEQGRGTVI